MTTTLPTPETQLVTDMVATLASLRPGKAAQAYLAACQEEIDERPYTAAKAARWAKALDEALPGKPAPATAPAAIVVAKTPRQVKPAPEAIVRQPSAGALLRATAQAFAPDGKRAFAAMVAAGEFSKGASETEALTKAWNRVGMSAKDIKAALAAR